MADRSDAAKNRHGQWVFALATAGPPEIDLLKAHRLTRKDAWPNFARFLIAVGTRWGTWGEEIRPSLDRIEEATGVDRSKASRWLNSGVSLGYLAVTREGSRGVATVYRISIPGEKDEGAPQAAPRKSRVPKQGRVPESRPVANPGPRMSAVPERSPDATTWNDLSPDAQAVFFWPAVERGQRWKPEYGSYDAALQAALANNPYLPV